MSEKGPEWYLLNPNSNSERTRHLNIFTWLRDTVKIKTLRTDFETGDGPADICLPNKRIVIEVKQKGRAKPDDPSCGSKRGETPKEQLKRYIKARKKNERTNLYNYSKKIEKYEEYVGIITDSQIWYIYIYTNLGKLEPIEDWKFC